MRVIQWKRTRSGWNFYKSTKTLFQKKVSLQPLKVEQITKGLKVTKKSIVHYFDKTLRMVAKLEKCIPQGCFHMARSKREILVFHYFSFFSPLHRLSMLPAYLSVVGSQFVQLTAFDGSPIYSIRNIIIIIVIIIINAFISRRYIVRTLYQFPPKIENS